MNKDKEIQKVIILEFAPTADEIWCISQHDRDGYAHYDAGKGLLSILDTDHDAKVRPEIITIYAGGKATNVARVMDRLMTGKDGVQVELVTFFPPPMEPLQVAELGMINGVSLRPSTAAGIYVQCLQIAALNTVKPHFEIVDELAETGDMQTTRRCIEITFKESAGSLNFSPRIVWSQKAAEAVRSRVSEVARDADMVVMAGAPPGWDVTPEAHLTPLNFYAGIMDVLDPKCAVSIDTRGKYLNECLISQKMPRFALMNTEEFAELMELRVGLDSEGFSGVVLTHDESGCWAWEGKLPDVRKPFDEAEYFPSASVPRVYSTIGAGDAMHAGFLREWICSEADAERLRRAVIYSQVVAGMSVSNEKASYGIDAGSVQSRFREIMGEAKHGRG